MLGGNVTAVKDSIVIIVDRGVSREKRDCHLVELTEETVSIGIIGSSVGLLDSVTSRIAISSLSSDDSLGCADGSISLKMVILSLRSLPLILKNRFLT